MLFRSAGALQISTPAQAYQFECHHWYDTVRPVTKVTADTTGWIKMEGMPRTEVTAFIDTKGDHIWAYGTDPYKQWFRIAPDGTGNLIRVLSSTTINQSADYK